VDGGHALIIVDTFIQRIHERRGKTIMFACQFEWTSRRIITSTNGLSDQRMIRKGALEEER